jgi:HK97 family phage portal protein
MALFESRSNPAKANDPRRSIFGTQSSTGIRITPETALKVSALLACVHIISETISTLPLKTFERLPGGGRQPARDYHLYSVLHDEANPEMSAQTFWETYVGHAAITGNALAEIEMAGNGWQVQHLWPLNPKKVSPMRDVNNNLVYEVTLPEKFGGEKRYLYPRQMLHTRWFSPDGVWAYAPIQLGSNSLGLAIAAEEFEAKYFTNGAALGVVYKTPNALSDKAYGRLHESLEARHVGLNNAHRIAILEEGLDAAKIGGSADEAQLAALRTLQAHDILRIYRMQPHKAGFLERSTNNNIEHQGIEFSTDTIRPWAVRVEQEIKRSLFLPSERKKYYSEFDLDGLMRGDILTRSQALHTQFMDGAITQDEWRALENRNPVPDGLGKVHYVALNLVPVDQAGNLDGARSVTVLDPETGKPLETVEFRPSTSLRSAQDQETRSARSSRTRRRIQRSYRGVYRDAMKRILRREGRDLLQIAKKTLATRSITQFRDALDEYYRDKHDESVMRDIMPVMTSYGEAVSAEAQDEINEPVGVNERLDAWMTVYADGFVDRHRGLSKSKIEKVLEGAMADDELDEIDALEAEFQRWEDERADDIAFEESVQFGNGMAVMVYTIAAVPFIQWVTYGENCPYCDSLAGMKIRTNEFFLQDGSEISPEGVDPLPVSGNKRYPPAHRGCDCGVAAGF